MKICLPRVICVLALVLSAACASGPNPPVDPRDSNTAPVAVEPLASEAVLSSVLLGFQLVTSPVSPGGAKSNRVEGHCVLKTGPKDTQDCHEVYILVTDAKTGRGPKVWADDQGRFEVPYRVGQRLSLVAVDDARSLRSNSIEVTKPGSFLLTMDPQLAHPANAGKP